MSFLRIILVGALFLFTGLSKADIKYDAVTNRFYTLPATADINQSHYQYYWAMIGLFIFDAERTKKILSNQSMFDKVEFSDSEGMAILKSIEDYLKGIGNPTALRLLSDLKKELAGRGIPWVTQ